MSVFLDPNTSLGFNRPLTQMVKRSLTITNPHQQPVAFKVKTTAPKLYCVRPNSGRVEPGESVEVSVMLQALKEEPPRNAKCKDKFLVQSTLLTPAKESKGLGDIWNVPEGTDEDTKVHQQKLKVTYLPPEGQTLEEEDESQVNEAQANQSSMMTNADNYDTVRQQPETNGHATVPEFAPDAPRTIERDDSPPLEVHDTQEEPLTKSIEQVEPAAPAVQEPVPAPAPEPVPAPAPAPVSVVIDPPAKSNSIPAPVSVEQSQSLSPTPPNEELMIKYQEAEAEIERLRSLLAAAQPPQTETRRRKTSTRVTSRYADDEASTRRGSSTVRGGGSDIGTVVDEYPIQQDGVPLQVVVIIALGVFVTTYLFF